MASSRSCDFHPTVLAVTTCADCERPLCKSCARLHYGKYYCPQDAASIFGSKGHQRNLSKTYVPLEYEDIEKEQPLEWPVQLMEVTFLSRVRVKKPLEYVRLFFLFEAVIYVFSVALLVFYAALIMPNRLAPVFPVGAEVAVVGLALLESLVLFLILKARSSIRQLKKSGGRLAVGTCLPGLALNVISTFVIGILGPCAFVLSIFALFFLALGWRRLTEDVLGNDQQELWTPRATDPLGRASRRDLWHIGLVRWSAAIEVAAVISGTLVVLFVFTNYF